MNLRIMMESALSCSVLPGPWITLLPYCLLPFSHLAVLSVISGCRSIAVLVVKLPYLT